MQISPHNVCLIAQHKCNERKGCTTSYRVIVKGETTRSSEGCIYCEGPEKKEDAKGKATAEAKDENPRRSTQANLTGAR